MSFIVLPISESRRVRWRWISLPFLCFTDWREKKGIKLHEIHFSTWQVQSALSLAVELNIITQAGLKASSSWCQTCLFFILFSRLVIVSRWWKTWGADQQMQREIGWLGEERDGCWRFMVHSRDFGSGPWKCHDITQSNHGNFRRDGCFSSDLRVGWFHGRKVMEPSPLPRPEPWTTSTLAFTDLPDLRQYDAWKHGIMKHDNGIHWNFQGIQKALHQVITSNGRASATPLDSLHRRGFLNPSERWLTVVDGKAAAAMT